MDNAFDTMQYFLANRSSPKENYTAYSPYDYDMARDMGLKRGAGPGAHMTDQPKLPWHPTFSNESNYYKPGMFAVDWNKPSGQQLDGPRAMPTTTPWIKQGATMTKGYEGFRENPYKDTKGIWTKGYGFNIPANKMSMKPITKEKAGDVFAPLYVDAMTRARKYAGAGAWDTMTPKQQMILTDMAYNLGNKLNGFENMQKAVRSGDRAGVKREIKDSDWYGQVGNRSKDHVRNW